MSILNGTLLEEKLFDTAWKARDRAWAPYSRFRVGAAVWVPELETIFSGVNVENASYGATICAERSAIVSIVSQHGKRTIGSVLVATDAEDPAVPCALCLQALAEFCPPTLPILVANSSGIRQRYTLSDLLPHPFTSFIV